MIIVASKADDHDGDDQRPQPEASAALRAYDGEDSEAHGRHDGDGYEYPAHHHVVSRAGGTRGT